MPKKIKKKTTETIVPEKEVSKYDKYNVELIQVGPLSGEYRFKTKGSDEFGWQVSARDLDEAYEKAEKIPAGLRR